MTMRVAAATLYTEARVEHELARLAGRPSRVGLDELARLGEAAFGSGADGDVLTLAVDALAARAAEVPGTAPSERSTENAISADLDIDRQLLDAGLHPALLTSFRELAEAAAESIVKREAAAHGNGATRSAERDASTMNYRGTWTPGSSYDRGAVTTYDGTIWHAEERTTDRPGASKSWRLMVKNKERAR